MASSDFVKMISGYGLTTANILYRMPDHPAILQNYVWQEYDLHPHFPELKKFLDFWTEKLEGPLHSIVATFGPTSACSTRIASVVVAGR